ncbi:MAG: hypothetical protein HY884_07850 [Deltaproteobacteria bacterium]|nr:hypothetical protein [Deltaproteobacteria bacterium]
MKRARFASVSAVSSILKTLLLIVPFAITSCAGFNGKSGSTFVIEGLSSPESVAMTADGKRVFISNMGEKLEPSAKDGDGYITEVSPDGSVITKKFLPNSKSKKLNGPKGMAIIGKNLYVADIDRVVGFDITTRAQVFEMDFSAEKTVFLNDLAVYDDKTLFLSATDIGKIFKLTLAPKPSYNLVEEGIAGPNGLYYDKERDRLYVVGFGEGGKFNGALGMVVFNGEKPKYTKLSADGGALDGVALLPGGRLIYSDWVAFDKPGMLLVYDLNTGFFTELKLSQPVRGPADLYYDAPRNMLWLPKMMEGKVLVEEVR